MLLLLPLFIPIYLLVKFDSRGPFFFCQDRLGKNANIFKVYKIRTMTDKPRVSNQEILKEDIEVTRIGSILRRFKIDEFPQIINIFLGDMSLVGPRPSLPKQINDFNEDGKIRLLVRPGLTGLAQVNGNIYLTWDERWNYDRYYVENRNIILDFKILFKTILILLNGEDKYLKKPNV